MHVPDFKLPPAGEGENNLTFGKLSALTTVQFEPVGRWFESYSARRASKHTLSHGSYVSSSSEEEEETEDLIEEEDENALLNLDPKNWKNQDHYSVLGLSKLRCKATVEQIKRAYKAKVLKHHPDKRRARGIPVKKEGEEDYFTCITRAYETLGVPAKRRAYDSVDPQFDESIPSASAIDATNFYEVFGPVFERNARWSTKRNVPQLGTESSPFDLVDKFYSFWYSFESWREYSYLDEEEKEKGENRDERRWIEKQNKAARQKLKKEETARIRQLVDNAYALDPRIIRYRTDEKEKKLQEKKAKQDAIRQKVEEEERKRQIELDAEREKKEKEEEAARLQAAEKKKQNDVQKKIKQQQKKLFRSTMKELDYMASDGAERVTMMQQVDKLAERISLTSLQALNEVLTSGDKDKAREALQQNIREMEEESEREIAAVLQAQRLGGANATPGGGDKVKDSWPEVELQMLIKAVNLFPAGTNSRWEVINSFLQMHVPGSNRTAKDVLAKAKELQKNDSALKEDANKKAFEKFTQAQGGAKVEVTEASQRYESAAETQIYEVGSNPAPWTADEQKLLEQAMRTYPASVPDRWDKIAAELPMRSKKDCMKRYKELVELIREKKLAQATVAAAKKT